MTNRDRYSVQQDINESEEDYLNRIKQIESQPYYPTIFKEKAANQGNLNVMSNLRNSLRDEVKITGFRVKITGSGIRHGLLERLQLGCWRGASVSTTRRSYAPCLCDTYMSINSPS
jgi:hypothetical protein